MFTGPSTTVIPGCWGVRGKKRSFASPLPNTVLVSHVVELVVVIAWSFGSVGRRQRSCAPEPSYCTRCYYWFPMPDKYFGVVGGWSSPSGSPTLTTPKYCIGKQVWKEEGAKLRFFLPNLFIPNAYLGLVVKQVSSFPRKETCFSPALTSTPGITGLTFLRIASPRVGKVPPCRLHGNVSIERS